MAAKTRQTGNAGEFSRQLLEEIGRGVYRPVYLLMGEEPYYPNLVCKAILENCIDDFSKDFNETVCYGADVNAERIISEARQFPMMAERRLIVVREAQLCKDIENVSVYLQEPLDSTVLVILMSGASADKRKALYKNAQKVGAVLESQPLRDYELDSWIQNYYRGRGLQIDPDAASLLGESTGTNLSAIIVETDKLLKNLPQGTTGITAQDIEKNVGISRQYSIFELTRELSVKNAPKALMIARRIGSMARFEMPMAVSALYNHFSRILRYGALLQQSRYPTPEQKAQALPGVNPYFYKEYDTAVRNYPVASAMAAVSLLCEYDYLGKGGDGLAASPDELMVELITKLLWL